MSTRQEKVNSVIQRLVSQYILTDGLEGITGIVTITEVDCTADLEHAKVFFSAVGQSEEEVFEVLKSNIYDIQGMLYQTLKMRKVPRLQFVPDMRGEYADKIGKFNSLRSEEMKTKLRLQKKMREVSGILKDFRKMLPEAKVPHLKKEELKLSIEKLKVEKEKTKVIESRASKPISKSQQASDDLESQIREIQEKLNSLQ